VERTIGRKLILFPGFCPTHARILPRHIEAARVEFPGAKVLVHPECRGETCLAADAVLSTGGMCKYAASSDAETLIIGTEIGLIHRLKKENPNKTIVPLLTQAECPNMKRNTLEKILLSLETLTPRITVEADIAKKAKRSIVRMLHGYVPGNDEVENG
jgi:quinolinate synthase